MYVPKTRKVMAVRDVIKKSELCSISERLCVVRDPNEAVATKRNRAHHCKKEEWHDAESMSRQQRTLRRGASVFEEAALDEESTATRVESQSYWKTVTQRTSHS